MEGAWVRFKVHGWDHDTKCPDRRISSSGSSSKPIVVIPTSFDATHRDLEYHIGTGKTFDPSDVVVIVINHFGNGQSFSPEHEHTHTNRHREKKNNRQADRQNLRYPSAVRYPDNVRAQKMVLDALGVSEIDLLYGFSMGAMQAFHWGAMFPSKVKRIAAVCGAAKTGNTNKIFLQSLKHAVMASKGWDAHSSRFTGTDKEHDTVIRAFARIYAGWGVSSELYELEAFRDLGFESLEDFSVRSYEGGFIHANVNNLMAQLDTWLHGNVAHADDKFDGDLEKALKAIEAPVAMMPCTTDRYFLSKSVEEQEYQMLEKALYRPIVSIHGHRAGDPSRKGLEAEFAFIKQTVEELWNL